MQAVEAFLKQENIKFSLAEMWIDPARQRVSSLCFLENDGKVLLLHRNKEPFKDFWTVPGGKLEPGEDPGQTVTRELLEETGLTLVNPRLQLITSETGNDFDYNWLLFLFRCTEFTGIIKECDEGVLSWVPRQQISSLRTPDVDRKLLPYILDDQQRYFIRLTYDEEHLVDSFETFRI